MSQNRTYGESRRFHTVATSLFWVVLTSCGSAAVPEAEVTTRVATDAGLEGVGRDVDAGVEPDSGTGSSEATEESAQEEPEEAPRFVMQGSELEGPFGSTAKACRWLKKHFIGWCIESKDSWNTGEALGKRGGFHAAKTLSVTIREDKGASVYEACAILVKTKRGWWLHGHTDACRSKDELIREGTRFATDLGQLTYADDLGVGVLLAEREGNRHIGKAETRDGQRVVSGAWVRQREIMYCAANKKGVPRCSDWHVVNCDSNERHTEHSGGEIVVTRGHPDGPPCADRMMKPGVYTLFEP